jgi:hypothetical protein
MTVCCTIKVLSQQQRGWSAHRKTPLTQARTVGSASFRRSSLGVTFCGGAFVGNLFNSSVTTISKEYV